MKKIMILLAALAMTTMAVQAEDALNVEKATSTIAATDTQEVTTDTNGDTNGTEEAAPEGK